VIGFDPSQEQREIQQLFREFSAAEIAPGATERDQRDEFHYDLIPKLAATGVFSLVFPKELGGLGGDTVSYVLALEEIGQADQSVAATVANQVGLSGMPIATFGSEAQKDRWLPELFAGRSLGATALTEPSSGSDAGNIGTWAEHVDGGWVLNGSKMFITNSGTRLTGFVIALTRTPSYDGPEGATNFIVPTASPGFGVGPNLKKMGWRSSDTHQVFFDDCRVGNDAVLGIEGGGYRQVLDTLDFGRIQIATLGVSLAQAALDSACRYAKDRTAFGRPIGDYQGVSFRLADMAVEVQAARLLTLEAAWRRDQGLEFAQQAAYAKLYASEGAMRAANACVQIHGGYGFMDDSTPSRLFRDAKVLEIGEGTSEIQRLVIGRALLRDAPAAQTTST
jgi:alkylation response protein AidB-like acyl-CoA dehydrogenase